MQLTRVHFPLFTTLLVFACLNSLAATAQVTPDSSLSTKVDSIDKKNFTILNGTQAGKNLFHSFKDFSIPFNGSAVFQNNLDIKNIFSRVTGGNLSNIDGLLKVSGNANLYLINPAGITFGKNATLNVGGSFFATTAKSLLFSDGMEFSALKAETPPLLSVNIPIGLKFRDNPKGITNLATNFFELATGKNFTLVGGEVKFDGGKVYAPGGRVTLGGLSQAGTVKINNDGSLQFPQSIVRADVFLNNGSWVDVTNIGGGNIDVYAQNLRISNGSYLLAGINGKGTANTKAGDIKINATGRVTLDKENNNSVSTAIANTVFSSSIGNAGNIFIIANSLLVKDRSLIASYTLGKGNAGNIFITAESLLVSGGAQINSSTLGIGNAGNINLKIINNATFSETYLFQSSGLFSAVGSNAKGNGGAINVQAGSLNLLKGAQFRTSTLGDGNAGNINLKITNNATFDGAYLYIPSGLQSAVDFSGNGNGGDINITSDSLNILNGAQFISTFRSTGLSSPIARGRKSGNINIKIFNTFKIDGFTTYTIPNSKKQTAPSGIFSGLKTNQGRGGDIVITAKNFFITNGGIISSNTSNFSKGDAGNIDIRVTDTINISGQILGFDTNGKSKVFLSSILSEVEEGANGKGGNIFIDPKRIIISEGGVISVNSLGNGSAGNIELIAGGLILNNGFITANAGKSRGGNIKLQLSDFLLLRNNSKISTNASGDGGNITINSPFIVAFPKDNSDITANSIDKQGGNIKINASSIYGIQARIQGNPLTNDITASSENGISGNIDVNNLQIDASQGLIELPEGTLDKYQVIRNEICRKFSKGSQFIIVGRGGIAENPTEMINNNNTRIDLAEPITNNLSTTNQTHAKPHLSPNKTISSDNIVPARGWVMNEKGEVILTAYDPTESGVARPLTVAKYCSGM
ncbi:two-partner secretion domain-containing protein [Calothrix sp. 336/3]|uniref:two-partner secretion domain-containing protein n=1 Tax=Calothrix sp. 336/3 TaxID=1337936 RepID=UPI0004E46C84|nr:filamentous hemagglutinin N-terminal domain-containing protein [Calothrix sp. 336/3]AKG22507.1 hypothetical protein IJ00_15620 [Calothrix sp. 336/3]